MSLYIATKVYTIIRAFGVLPMVYVPTQTYQWHKMLPKVPLVNKKIWTMLSSVMARQIVIKPAIHIHVLFHVDKKYNKI